MVSSITLLAYPPVAARWGQHENVRTAFELDVVHHGANRVAAQDRPERSGCRHIEHNNRNRIITAERNSRGVHDLEVFRHDLHVANLVVLHR